MAKTKKLLFAFLILSTLLASFGQLFFKLGIGSGMLVYLAAGFAAYLFSTFFYLHALGHSHLSWAYGVGGLSYIFASILALFFLGETISPLRWLGILVIAFGTALVAIS